MKYYKLSMDMDRENDIICHFDKKFNISQNALIVGKYYNDWDDNLVIHYSPNEGNVWSDYLANDKGWFLISERLRTVLEQLNTDIQFLNVKVKDYNGEIENRYYFANVLRVVDALCLEKSDYFETEIEGIGIIYTVSRYAIYSEKTGGSDVFKLANKQEIPLFVSEKFKKLIEVENLKGMKFTEIAVI